ncbi:hypothetical protein PtA15_17A79 [Puccinia triticina]|uniref:Uncharacterized protein n=1 Tax=Puccinia triticina TaxID=208348 RepID=A0ABY7D6B4_9BASI|nr:uncharacterized protein PtA15_17A79 [Puccinia triticina]WAQ92598.1 hypothetical protein PtA15_17A79 [Puccinia triticina]
MLTLAAKCEAWIVKKGGAKAHTKTIVPSQRKEITKFAYVENHKLHNQAGFSASRTFPHLVQPSSAREKLHTAY